LAKQGWCKERPCPKWVRNKISKTLTGRKQSRKTILKRAKSLTRPLEERFLEKVLKTKRCWFWTACKAEKGHGIIQGPHRKGHIRAHRLSWEIHNGRIPKGLWVLHKRFCNTSSCVNPKHLYLGTVLENNRDLMASGNHWTPFVKGHKIRWKDCRK